MPFPNCYGNGGGGNPSGDGGGEAAAVGVRGLGGAVCVYILKCFNCLKSFPHVDVYLERLHGPCVLSVVNRMLKHMQVLSIHSKMKQKRNKVFAKFRSMTRYFTLLF